ncbi:MAG: hypothetical protein U5L07_04825 [Desulfobacterales bacterium]|nr:hypothetical protein [Desulfobacterales bacterium]
MKKTCFIIALTFISILMFGEGAFSADLTGARIIPENQVIVQQDGKTIGKYTKEAALPTGAAMSCEGRCGIRLTDISMLAEDQSIFAMGTESGSRYMHIKKGKIYFALSRLDGSFVFVTPKGAVSADQAIRNASTDSGMIKGYIQVDDKNSEIGIIEGGSLKIATKDKDELLEPGQKFILAQADVGTGTQEEEEESDRRKGAWWKLSGGKIAGFTVAGVATAGALIGIGSAAFDDDDDEARSPAFPE